MSEEPPLITVLMSTYNGAPYLRDQVESVLSQERVNVCLVVRDDLSTDGSADLLSSLSAEYPGMISLVRGEERLGAAKSFLELARHSVHLSEWYAYCDQDDVWLPDKLVRAVEMMNGLDLGRGRLYASATTICDGALNVVGDNVFPDLRLTVGAEFARHRLSGHTMVFDEPLLGALNSLSADYGFPHDHLLCSVACASGAQIAFDTESRVLHRRLESSVTPGGNGVRRRISHEFGLIRNARGLDRSGLASELLSRFSEEIEPEVGKLLEDISDGTRIRLLGALLSGRLSTGLWAGDAETAISIVMGTF